MVVVQLSVVFYWIVAFCDLFRVSFYLHEVPAQHVKRVARLTQGLIEFAVVLRPEF